MTLDRRVDNAFGYLSSSTGEDIPQPTCHETEAGIGELDGTIKNAGENRADPISEVLSGRELIKLTEQHIIGDFEGRDLRPGGPIP